MGGLGDGGVGVGIGGRGKVVKIAGGAVEGVDGVHDGNAFNRQRP